MWSARVRRQMLESKWASELSSTQDGQKREYKQWVMQMHADSQTDRQAVAPPVYAYVSNHLVQWFSTWLSEDIPTRAHTGTRTQFGKIIT